jgi:hypothetical protein
MWPPAPVKHTKRGVLKKGEIGSMRTIRSGFGNVELADRKRGDEKVEIGALELGFAVERSRTRRDAKEGLKNAKLQHQNSQERVLPSSKVEREKMHARRRGQKRN